MMMDTWCHKKTSYQFAKPFWRFPPNIIPRSVILKNKGYSHNNP